MVSRDGDSRGCESTGRGVVLTLGRLRRVLCGAINQLSLAFLFLPCPVPPSESGGGFATVLLYSPSGKVMVILNRPPSHMVFSLPGMPHSQTLRSSTPSVRFTGRAQNPKGWSFLHCFLRRRLESATRTSCTRCWNVSEHGICSSCRVGLPLLGQSHGTKSHGCVRSGRAVRVDLWCGRCDDMGRRRLG